MSTLGIARVSPLFKSASARLVLRASCRSFHSSLPLYKKTVKVLPTQVVIAAYNSQDTAKELAKDLKKATRKGEISCKNTATITKNSHGHVHIKEAGEIKTHQGVAVGAVLGSALAFLLGPVTISLGALGGAAGAAAAGAEAGLGAAVGANVAARATLGAAAGGATAGGMVGGYAAHKTETLDHSKLKDLGEVLQPSNSALVAVFEQVLIPMELLDEKAKDRDQVMANLAQNVGDVLRRGDDVAYMLAVTDDGILTTKTVTGDAAADIKSMVITGDGVAEGEETVFPEDTVEYEVVDGELMAKDDSQVAK